MSFLIKNNQISNPLGNRLKEARGVLGISLFKASKDLGIAIKYLEAIENNNPKQLPRTEYFNLFLKKYSQYLKLDYLALQKLAEKQTISVNNKKDKNNNFFSWFKFNRWMGVSLLVFVLLTFLLWNINSIFRPPKLEIFSPLDGAIVFQRQLEIKGKTIKEAEITINNRSILVDVNGNFSALIDLQNGLNLIKISAKKRYSRFSNVEIRVLLINKH